MKNSEKSFETIVNLCKNRGFVHLYLGEEAVATGVCECLRDDDYITSTHRGHGHIIAKGGDLKYMMAELFGKATGYCKGKGGSMHIADRDRGILGANGIVGAGHNINRCNFFAIVTFTLLNPASRWITSPTCSSVRLSSASLACHSLI